MKPISTLRWQIGFFYDFSNNSEAKSMSSSRKTDHPLRFCLGASVNLGSDHLTGDCQIINIRWRFRCPVQCGGLSVLALSRLVVWKDSPSSWPGIGDRIRRNGRPAERGVSARFSLAGFSCGTGGLRRCHNAGICVGASQLEMGQRADGFILRSACSCTSNIGDEQLFAGLQSSY